MKNIKGLSPVSRYAVPGYPSKREVLVNPAILKSLPMRWSAKPAICAALTMTLVTGLFGCDGNVLQPIAGLSGSESSKHQPSAAHTFPVFEHGSGRGAYGCMMVAPPVFLSEEEALQAIREETAVQGIHFTGTRILAGDHFPATNLYGDEDFNAATWEGSLELDGYDSALNISFEFVSQQDVVDWAKEGNMSSSVESYDMKGTAERLADVLENTAVFYDPGSDPKAFDHHQIENGDFETYFSQYEAEQKALMIKMLREQVRDFLAWLAAEGVI
jgi:hypothetical protein